MKKRLLVLALLLVVGGLLAPKVSTFVEKRRFYTFIQDLWLQKKSAERYQDRYYMAQFLLDQDLLQGKDRAEVYELLGQPDWGGNGYFRYKLGPRRDTVLAFGSEVWLTFSLNEDGDIRKISILPD